MFVKIPKEVMYMETDVTINLLMMTDIIFEKKKIKEWCGGARTEIPFREETHLEFYKLRIEECMMKWNRAVCNAADGPAPKE